ncbi:MAG: hypothetical protein QOG46_317 [Pseudonocardiales bacterium]|jgi:hypothetical protein|nr:hypothetical protein [Pseudonocardiales bacterium]
MDISIRLQIRGPSPYFTDPSHLEEAEALADELRNMGLGTVEVEIGQPEPGAPMASGVAEWLMVYVAGPGAGTLTALAVTDLYRICKRWVGQRMRRPEQQTMRFGKGVILGPDGSLLREWQTTRLPDGTVADSDPD